MSLEDEQKNNPLHGLGLEALLTELIDHYGWEILAEYTNINCFKNKPSKASSVKFLKKTQWAREKLEAFYLYKFKRMPKPDDIQYEMPPRERYFPVNIVHRSPAELILGQAPKPVDKGKPQQRSARNTRTRTKSIYDSANTSSSHTKRAKHDNEPRNKKANSNQPWSPWDTVDND